MPTDLTNNPVLWFTTMQIEAERGNFDKAAQAKKELERLGVFVRFKAKKVQRRYKQAERKLLARRSPLTGSLAI